MDFGTSILMESVSDFISENRLAIGVVAVVCLVGFGLLGRGSPSIDDFVQALRKTNSNVETFSGADLKDMNTLVNSGKGGALIFTIIARTVVYADGVFSKKQAEAQARQALDEMTTLKVDGVLVSVWRYAFSWQAQATLAIEKLIHDKDMASTLGSYCREPGHENRITCSKFTSFVHQNFFVTISYIKEKVVLKGGQFVDHVPFDEPKIQSLRNAIDSLRI